MSEDQLAALGIHVDKSPSGDWFVSRFGWGRRVGKDAQKAMQFAVNLAQDGRLIP